MFLGLQAQRPSTVAPGLASMLQRPATHLQQGLRLSELVPQHAARGLNPALLSRPPTTSGGPGGPHDPWKALAIRWDYGTPPYWPIRVSPWEVGLGLHLCLNLLKIVEGCLESQPSSRTSLCIYYWQLASAESQCRAINGLFHCN